MSDITKRINALFAKAESTDSAEEAQALFAKAEELMLKHAIDRAALEAARSGATTRQRITREWIKYDGHGAPKGFWTHLGKAGSFAITQTMAGRIDMAYAEYNHQLLLVGAPEDIEYVKNLLRSVWAAAYSNLLRWRRETDWKHWSPDVKFKADRGYLAGFCAGVASSLQEQQRETERRYPGALALIDRTPEIRREMGETKTGRSVRVPGFGYADGVRDGRNHSFARGEVGR